MKEKALSKPLAQPERERSKSGAKSGNLHVLESVMKLIFFICGFIAIAFVLVITIYLILSGLPAIQEIGLAEFLFGTEWASTAEEPKFGILPLILTSVYGTAGAIVIGVPIGFLMAMFLSKVAPRRVASVIRPVVDLLAGIPSIVYGLVGLMVLVPFVRTTFKTAAGESLLASIVVLAVMILPSIISVSETALNAVPREYEEASLALGATEIETYFRVSAPAAKSGIAAAVVLGVGRAIGEAMAIMMVAGNVANMPDLLSSVRFLTTGIAVELAYSSGLQRQALFSIGLVLFLFIMFINVILNVVLKRKKEG
ncbi:phosphate ABC transporter permease subunit PstC [Pseudoflavonifractor capillosus]|nr:phosphate ABC transporter permease subunit PstC [Pseudoflavonifractor capillosus]